MKETISRLYSGRTHPAADDSCGSARTMRLLFTSPLRPLLPPRASCEFRFFPSFLPSFLPILFFRVQAVVGGSQRGPRSERTRATGAPGDKRRSMIQHERAPTDPAFEIVVPGRTQIWIYAGPAAPLVCHACKSA